MTLMDFEFYVYLLFSQPLSPSKLSEFILNRETWGQAFGHFLPYQQSCNYCDFDFDAIIDVNELSHMMELIADNLNITVSAIIST